MSLRTRPEAGCGFSAQPSPYQRGVDAFEELGLLPTTTVSTARGSHYYFVGKSKTAANVLPDVEVRGTGSGVLAPGSVHPSGFLYDWEIPPWEVPPVGVPPELADLIGKTSTTTGVRNLGPVLQGGRHVHLLRVAGSLRGRHGVEHLVSVLWAVNEVQCRPPLSEDEVAKVANDARRYGRQDWVADPRTYIYGDERLSLLARSLLGVYVNHADHSGECFPGVRRLSALLGISQKRVVSGKRELVENGRVKFRKEGRKDVCQLLPYPLTPTPIATKGRTYANPVGSIQVRTKSRKDRKFSAPKPVGSIVGELVGGTVA